MMTTGPAGDLKKTPEGKVSVRLGARPGDHGCMEIINE
jgi:hypothetical protein